MLEDITTPIRTESRDRGEWNPTSTRIPRTPTPSEDVSSIEEISSSQTSSGGSSWISETSDHVLPEGDMPPELNTPEIDIDVESRYWRIVFRDRRNIIQFFGLEGDWENAGELDENSYFVGRRLYFN